MIGNLTVLAPLLAAGFLQDVTAPRSPGGRFLARLEDEQGKALADAPVFFLARAHPQVTALPALDRLEVQSGKKGRIQARLIRGLEYGVYAVHQEGPRSYSWTAVMGGVQAGERRLLKLEAEPNGRVRVRVEGREAWKSEEPLRFSVQVTSAGGAPWVERDFDPEGKQYLPMMPGRNVKVRVQGRSGLLLCQERLWISKSSLEKKARRHADFDRVRRAKERLLFVEEDLLRLRIEAPVEMLVEVREEQEKKGGLIQRLLGGGAKPGPESKPIPGARIWVCDGISRFLGAECDEKGFAIVKIPKGVGKTALLLIEADGYAERVEIVNMFRVQAVRDLEAMRKSGSADVQVELFSGKSSKTRISLEGGRPAAGMAVLLSSSLIQGRETMVSFGRPMLFRTDDKGMLRIPGRLPEQSCRLDLVLDLKAREDLTPEGGNPPHPLVTLYQGIRLPRELPKEFDLSRLARVEIQVQNRPGADREPAEVVMARIRRKAIDMDSRRSVMADPRGRLTILLPEAGEWALGACTTSGIKLTRLLLQAGKAPGKVELRLHAPLFIEGIVQTSEEEPIQGTTVSFASEQGRRPELDLMGGFTRYKRAMEPVCDEKGRFRIPVPTMSTVYTLSFATPMGLGGTISMSDWNRKIEVGKESTKDVEITIDPPGGL